MEPLARIELSGSAPAEFFRLLPLVGLQLVSHADAASPLALSGPDAPRTAPPVAIRVDFDAPRPDTVEAVRPAEAVTAPATLAIAFDSTPFAEHATADFVTDSANAAVCFILSRVLGLTAPFLTADLKLFDVLCAATAVARGPARILVVGEVGVGKESLIKLIHAASGDPTELVHAECAALEVDAVEAEIAPLLAQVASPNPADAGKGGGAIFFNRIGELSPAAQRKLLDLLRSVLDVPDSRGAFAPQSVRDPRRSRANVRIFAASTRPLAAMVAGGEVLSELCDLFDATLTISPLRARRGDLPLLARHYLRGLNSALTLNAAAMRALTVYPFPGNVLELINLLTRVAIIPPKRGTRRSAIGHPSIDIVGRAEVISQLDRGSLSAVWHSREQWDSRFIRTRRKHSAPTLRPDDGEAVAALPLPASMRLTTGTEPRQRKPRSSHYRPA